MAEKPERVSKVEALTGVFVCCCCCCSKLWIGELGKQNKWEKSILFIYLFSQKKNQKIVRYLLVCVRVFGGNSIDNTDQRYNSHCILKPQNARVEFGTLSKYV